MERWEQETYKYATRLECLRSWQPDLSDLIRRLPDVPLNYKPSPTGNAALVISMFALRCMGSAKQATSAFLNLWRDGQFAIISLPARFSYELWGAVHYARNTLLLLQDHDKLNMVLERTGRLVVGARYPVSLPWGGTATQTSINVMDFIRSLAESSHEAEDTYNFLCESCHPSFLMLTTWSLTGPPVANWQNEKFNEHAHSLLRRTLDAFEQALYGMSSDITMTLESALPYIAADRA